MATVAAAYTVRGAIGFASNLVVVTLLARSWALDRLVPVVFLLDFAGSLLLGAYDVRRVRWDELLGLAFGIGMGLGASWAAWVVAPGWRPLGGLGAVTVAYAVWGLAVRPERLPHWPRWTGLPLGVAAGFLGGWYGTGVLPIAAYFQLRHLDPGGFRATFQGVGLVFSGLGIAGYAAAGRLGWPTVAAALVLLPAVAGGLWLGHRMHRWLSRRGFAQAVLAVLGGLGLSLWWAH